MAEKEEGRGAGGRARPSGCVPARQLERTLNTTAIAVYDGREPLGFIHETGDGRHHAIAWPDDRKLGAFKTRKAAADAITRAGKSSGALS